MLVTFALRMNGRVVEGGCGWKNMPSRRVRNLESLIGEFLTHPRIWRENKKIINTTEPDIFQTCPRFENVLEGTRYEKEEIRQKVNTAQ